MTPDMSLCHLGWFGREFSFRQLECQALRV